ncbi:MAG: PEGA domain-containing protein [Planctomycetes bacterium]|nr:PEGA domain-containing protein [Planctomycetota bacterium]
MRQKKRLQIILTVAICLSAVLLSGCVERKLTINTVPTGAIVELNDEEIGTSPVTVAFNWYGDYRIRASMDGYETLETHRKLKAPMRDHFPFDFFAQVLWPGKIVDEYNWTFDLEKYEAPDREKLIKQSLRMKEQLATEAATKSVVAPK